jgi:hypothetical protein
VTSLSRTEKLFYHDYRSACKLSLSRKIYLELHRNKHRRRITETGGKDKTAVMGMLERNGQVRAMMVPNRCRKLMREQLHVLRYAAQQLQAQCC